MNLPLESWFQQEEVEGARFGDVRWALSSSGIFFVSSVRYAIDDFSLVSGDHKEFIWSNWVPSRVNVPTWKVFQGRLPTKSNLGKRGLPLVSTCCPLCSFEVEDENHLFIGCNISRKMLLDICSLGVSINPKTRNPTRDPTRICPKNPISEHPKTDSPENRKSDRIWVGYPKTRSVHGSCHLL